MVTPYIVTKVKQMAKTRAEIQREYRERKKALAKAERAKPAPALDPNMTAPTRSFAAFLKEREGNLLFPENLHWVGVEVATDLTRETPHLERASGWQDMGLDVNSLTIATGMVDVFIDAAKELAELINAYKIEEIDRQMSGATPAKGEQLEALRARLAKKTSHFFPVIE